MNKKLFIKSVRKAKNLKGKRVLLRADFNVPLEEGRIKDDFKIIAALPTIRYLLRYRCKIIIISHLGRPGGKRVKKYTLRPVAVKLSRLIGKKIKFIEDCLDQELSGITQEMKEGQIIFLENLRFYSGEESDNKLFSKKLSKLADLNINDAFAVSHRLHASVSAIKRYLPAYAGLLLEKEILNLNKALSPEKPLVVIVGGAKVSTKLPILKSLSAKAEYILVGGVIANNFLQAANFEIGRSLIEKDYALLKKVKRIYNQAGSKIILPIDVLVSRNKNGTDIPVLKNISQVNKSDIILDIGPKTVSFYSNFIKKAKTIIWNGPLGKFESKHYKHGTLMIARVVAARSGDKAFGLAGGGETVEALRKTKMMDNLDWISTGGGAMFAFLAGQKMPGLKGILRK